MQTKKQSTLQKGRGIMSCFTGAEKAKTKEAVDKFANRFLDHVRIMDDNKMREHFQNQYNNVRGDPGSEANFFLQVVTTYGTLRSSFYIYEDYYTRYEECGGANDESAKRKYEELKAHLDRLDKDEQALMAMKAGGARSRKKPVTKKPAPKAAAKAKK